MLKIFIDRLDDGQVESIREEIPPDFIDIHEKDCDFSFPVKLNGEAYLASDHLIIHLQAQTLVSLRCSVCNRMTELPISVDFTHTVPLSEVTTPIFDYSASLREDLLLQLPLFFECPNCPERETVNKYLKHNSSANFPFSDLEK